MASDAMDDDVEIFMEPADEEGMVEAEMGEPDLPDDPEFTLPDEDVFLELPGANESEGQVARDAETISIDFPEEDVRNIIRNVADLYELNVVIPDTLTGSVSIKLRNVTWRQVFDVILEPLNYTYIEDGNIIKLKSNEELLAEPTDTRVFVINFAKAEEIRGSVEPLVDSGAGGKIQVDSRSNALVITERPSKMNGIQEIIETLDKPTEQVMIESKFVEVTARQSKNIGIDWQSLAGYSMSAGPFDREYTNEDGRNSLDSNTSTENLNINSSNAGTNTTFTTDEGVTRQVDWTGDLLKSDTAVFSADAFQVVLSALEGQTEVELISNPTVVTMNNNEATINIGEEYPIPSYTYNDERGTYEISNFAYKNIGINLDVTPQINSAGFINLNIQPEISSRSGEVSFGGASGALIPIITTRRTQSMVTIKSGYTLAIGGLIEKTTNRRDSSVPLLGDLPMLGKFFSSESDEVDSRNLIVFITAKILSASGATYRDVFSQRTLYEMGIKARDLPGYEPPPSERELFDSIQEQRDQIEQLQTEMRLREQLKMLNESKDEQRKKENNNEPREIRRRFQ